MVSIQQALSQKSTPQEMTQFLQNLTPFFPKWGGRRFVDKNQIFHGSLCLNDIVKSVDRLAQPIIANEREPQEETVRLLRESVEQIYQLDATANRHFFQRDHFGISRLSFCQRILTFVRQIFGNWGYNRNEVLSTLQKKLYALPETIQRNGIAQKDIKKPATQQVNFAARVPDKEVEEILVYWFDYANHPQSLYNCPLWWDKNLKVDQEIKERFGQLQQAAVKGQLNCWLNSPKGTLAYIILIDQFSRNIYRNTDEMYQYDYLALNAAQTAIKKKFHHYLSLTERQFLYMPFQHAEDLAAQTQSVTLFEKLVTDTPVAQKSIAESCLDCAKKHYEIIKKFTRFPHRNGILSRKNTSEEESFMKTHGGF